MSSLSYKQQNYNHCTNCFNWLKWDFLIITHVSAFANNTTLGHTFLQITIGLEHFNKNLAQILLALEMDIFSYTAQNHQPDTC